MDLSRSSGEYDPVGEATEAGKSKGSRDSQAEEEQKSRQPKAFGFFQQKMMLEVLI